jgi:hypothetical protein
MEEVSTPEAPKYGTARKTPESDKPKEIKKLKAALAEAKTANEAAKEARAEAERNVKATQKAINELLGKIADLS